VIAAKRLNLMRVVGMAKKSDDDARLEAIPRASETLRVLVVHGPI